MKYRREIDGLRAVAVTVVILFHAGIAGFEGGFLGVDVFFVISGFLISTILMHEVESDRFSLTRFYERRARRILPALFVMMAVVTVAATAALMPDDLMRFGRSLVAVPLFASNVLFRRESGYFAPVNELKPLLHTWSLAVEEQFYLLFPLLLILLRRWTRSITLWFFALVFAVSLAAAEWGSIHRPTPAFFWLPTRFWEPLAGFFVAYAVRSGWRDRLSDRTAAALSTAGLLLVFGAMAASDSNTRTPSLLTLVPVIGTMMYLTWSKPTDPAGWLLSTRAMVGVGLVSYSAYLWHQPLFALGRYLLRAEFDAKVQVGLIALTFALAYASWRWVEQPFRDARFNRRQIFSWSLAGSLLFIGLGSVAVATEGFAERYINALSPADKARYEVMRANTGEVADRTKREVGECQFFRGVITPEFEARFDACAASHGKADLIVGDSHGQQLFGALAQADPSRFVVGIAKGGCHPFDVNIGCHYEPALAFATARKEKIARMIFSQAGFYLFSSSDGAPGSRDMFQRRELPPFALAEPAIEANIAYLARFAAVAPVVWVGPGIEPHIDFTNFRELREAPERAQPALEERYRALDTALIARLGREGSAVRYLSRIQLFEAKQPLRLYEDGCLTYRDYDHLSPCSERRLGPALLRALQ
jgi:peptidoglycan/LPS O-acetylase OafA/YrhL